jgi:hypothetical protein
MNLQTVNSNPVRCWNPAISSFCISSAQWLEASRKADVVDGAATELDKAIAYAQWRRDMAELGAYVQVRDAYGTVTFVKPSRA